MELSTPVVKLWQGILALPLIGTLDSARTQVVMENLLKRIVETGADIAIIDITGVPTVDTLVAQHLLKTVAAARLMGAECIISGIRPQIAQTIVHLGVDLRDVTTKATLADAFAHGAAAHAGQVRRSSSGGDRDEVADGTYSDPENGRFLLVTIQVDMHDRLAMTLQDDLTERDRRRQRARRADRHLGAGNRRFFHRPHARQHRRHGARAGCRNRRGRHAARRRHHAGGAGLVAARRAHGSERGTRNELLLRVAAIAAEGDGDDRAEDVNPAHSSAPTDVVLVRQAVRDGRSKLVLAWWIRPKS